jgi:hypothetical protein
MHFLAYILCSVDSNFFNALFFCFPDTMYVPAVRALCPGSPSAAAGRGSKEVGDLGFDMPSRSIRNQSNGSPSPEVSFFCPLVL